MNVLDMAANSLGEYLRRQFWKHVSPSHVGGYNQFEYYSDVYNITSVRDQDGIVHNHAYKDIPDFGQVHLHWYWDGDGDITFTWSDRRLNNDDAKKDHTWAFLTRRVK